MNKTERQDRAFYDKLQTRLTAEGIKPNDFKYAETPTEDYFHERIPICPFCLNRVDFSKWKKTDKRTYECPKCFNKMFGATLKEVYNLDTVERYAKWVYDYRLNGFFSKIISFEEFNIELKILKIQQEFWDAYKKFKGENQNEE